MRDFAYFPRLETANFVLRDFIPDDAQALLQIYADRAVTQYLGYPLFASVQEAEQLIQTLTVSYQDGTSIDWAITEKQSGQLRGRCRLYAWHRETAQAEIGYALARPSWGQGVMREVLPVIITFGFERLTLQQIKARTAPQNLRSIKLLEYLGFVRMDVHGLDSHDGPAWQPVRFSLQHTGLVTKGMPPGRGASGVGAAP